MNSNLKELRKAKKLENFIYFRLNVQKNYIATLWLHQLQEGRK